MNTFVTVEHIMEEWLSSQSTTPLISTTGSTRCLDLLIGAGADVNFVNDEGSKALINAASLGAPDCVNMLLHAGADVNICNKNGETALMVIGRKKKVADEDKLRCVKLLLESGAHVNIKNK